MKFKDWLSIILMLLPAIILVCIGREDLILTFELISLATVLIINIDKLKSIKAFGLEAEMQVAIKEAYATIEQMKELQTTETAILLNLICKRRYIFSNDIEKSIENINQLYLQAKKFGNEKNVELECKKAYAKLIGMELKDLIDVMYISTEKKYTLLTYYNETLDSNLLTDNKGIPTIEALEKANLLKINDGNKIIPEHINSYKYILNEYEKQFGTKDFVDKIDLDKMKIIKSVNS